MRYGIKTPDLIHRKSYIWWIAEDEHRAWQSFFQYPSQHGYFNPHRAPMDDAIRAYKSIGYECVEIEIIEKET